MKKIFLLAFCFVVSFALKAQIALAKPDGTPITDGQIFTYNTTVESLSTFYYKILNTSSSPINARIKVLDLVNANGTSVQLCYEPTCKFTITEGAVYPTSGSIVIAANSETSSTGYNFWNNNPGDGINYPMDYVLKFYRVDGFNNEVGNSVTITYRYNPNAMGVNDANTKNLDFALVSTKIGNVAEIFAKDVVSYTLYSMNGTLVSKGNLNKGNNSIDTSILKSGIYMIHLKNKSGETITKKLVK